MDTTIEFCIFKLLFVSFWTKNLDGPNLSEKGLSGLNQKKWLPPLNSVYVQIRLGTKFQL